MSRQCIFRHKRDNVRCANLINSSNNTDEYCDFHVEGRRRLYQNICISSMGNTFKCDRLTDGKDSICDWHRRQQKNPFPHGTERSRSPPRSRSRSRSPHASRLSYRSFHRSRSPHQSRSLHRSRSPPKTQKTIDQQNNEKEFDYLNRMILYLESKIENQDQLLAGLKAENFITRMFIQQMINKEMNQESIQSSTNRSTLTD